MPTREHDETPAQQFRRLREMEASDYLRRMARQQKITPIQERINVEAARLIGWLFTLGIVAIVVLCAAGIVWAVVNRCSFGC